MTALIAQLRKAKAQALALKQPRQVERFTIALCALGVTA